MRFSEAGRYPETPRETVRSQAVRVCMKPGELQRRQHRILLFWSLQFKPFSNMNVRRCDVWLSARRNK